MKTIQRIAALMLALLLSLSIALPALADAHNETAAFGSSVVLVNCPDTNRKVTGVVVGSLTNPSDVYILVHPWVVDNMHLRSVDVTTAKKTYKGNTCYILNEYVAVVIPNEVFGSVSPLILQSSANVPVGSRVMQLYNTGANAVYAHNGNFKEHDTAFIGHAGFELDDLNRLQADPWKSLGTAITYTGRDGVHYLIGTTTNVVPSTGSIYYLDSLYIAALLESEGITTYARASDFPSIELVPLPTEEPAETDAPVATTKPKLLSDYVEERDQKLSSKQLTQTIVLIVAGVVILAAIVAIVLVLVKRSKGGSTNTKGAAYKLVGLTGQLSGREFPLTSTLTLGRSTACNIVFSNNAAGVSGRHCEVSVKGGVVYLKDLGSSYGTLDNNSKKIPANEPVILRRGESFFLGSKENGFMLR